MEYKFTKENFDEEVMNSDKPVLIDFYAEWCMPCKIMGPEISRLASEFEGIAKVGKVNVDEQQGLAREFGVSGIPFLAIIKDGKVVDRALGVTSGEVLGDKLRRAV